MPSLTFIRGNQIIYVGAALLVAALILLMSLVGFIENRLQIYGEDHALALIELEADVVSERAIVVENAIYAFTTQSDDPEMLTPELSTLQSQFDFTLVAFAHEDGIGFTSTGDTFSTASLSTENPINPALKTPSSATYTTADNTCVRLYTNPLYANGTYLGTLYVEIAVDSLISPAESGNENTLIGPPDNTQPCNVLLFSGATGLIVASSNEDLSAYAPVGTSIFDVIANTSNNANALESLLRFGKPAASATANTDTLKQAIETRTPALVPCVINGENVYVSIAPTRLGSWFACQILPVSKVHQEATATSTMLICVFALGALCVVIAIIGVILLYHKQRQQCHVQAQADLYAALSENIDFSLNLYTPYTDTIDPIVAKGINIFGVSTVDLFNDSSWLDKLQFSKEGIALYNRIRKNEITERERVEFSFIKLNTTTMRYAEAIAQPITYDGKNQILLITRDVTEAQIIQNAMSDTMHAAEAANNAKTVFLSRMSHEIRTPMNVILGMISIAEHYVDDRDRLLDSLHNISKASRHLLSLINEVLDISKIESGKAVFDEKIFSLKTCIDTVVAIISPQCVNKHQEFVVKLEGPVDAPLKGDPTRVRQMLVNLLTNAVKYTNEGGHISLTVRVEPALANGYRRITYIVSDDGIGMTPEYLDHLFEPFVMENRSHEQGTGLGMPIVKNIVHAMGGDIMVESNVDRGTTFTVVVDKRFLPNDDSGSNNSYSCVGSHCSDHSYSRTVVVSGSATLDSNTRSMCVDNPTQPNALDVSHAPDNSAKLSKSTDKITPENELAPEAKNPKQKDDISTSKATSPVEKPERPFEGLRVLLVEDSDLNAEIASELLGFEGMIVDWAADGKQGLDAFAASDINYYDIILIDIRMPVMDGYEATRAIRALDRADAPLVPIIAMSANAFVDDILASIKSGMNDHLSKPIDMKSVRTTIAEQLEKRREAENAAHQNTTHDA